MYARCVHWLRPKDKTGAKLVSMHETVISPTEYRSRHEALRVSWRCRRRGGELRGRVGGLGGLPGSLGVTSGQDRSFRTASCGVAPGDAGGGSPFQGLDCHPDQIPRPPFDRIARIGRPAGAIFRGLRCPGSCLQPPRSRRGGGTAPVTHACHQARGEVRPNSITPIRHPSESWDLRRGRTTSHPYIVTPDLFRDPPSGLAATSRWMPERACPEPVEGSGTTNALTEGTYPRPLNVISR